MINTIIIDLDGPILDGILKHYNCYSDILRSLGYQPIDIKLYWMLKRQRVSRNVLLTMTSAQESYKDFLSMWINLIENKTYLQYDKLQNNVIQALNILQENGSTIVLCTMRSNRQNLLDQLDSFNITKYFNDIISVDFNSNKSEAVRHLVKDNDTIWIGDTEKDINSGKTLNIKTCALTCGLRTQEYLSMLNPDYLYNNLYTSVTELFNQNFVV